MSTVFICGCLCFPVSARTVFRETFGFQTFGERELNLPRSSREGTRFGSVLAAECRRNTKRVNLQQKTPTLRNVAPASHLRICFHFQLRSQHALRMSMREGNLHSLLNRIDRVVFMYLLRVQVCAHALSALLLALHRSLAVLQPQPLS